MSVIYEPTGKAKEYADLAINIYNGCTHRCLYCYGPEILHITPEDFHKSANPKKGVVPKVRREAAKLSMETPEINLSFIGDVYQPEEMKFRMTREVIKILIENDLRFTILTKGGSRAARDFDLLESYDKCSFGTTLVFTDQGDADEWELNSPSITDRIRAIERAHSKGIKTWVSVEPVIKPDQALTIIRDLHPVVDHWKVGKLNYHKEIEARVDWLRFREEARALLNSLGADYYLKKSLTDL